MSTLLDASGRVVPVLGLPPLLDELRDVPPLPPLRGRPRRLLRSRSTAPAARRRRGPFVLGGRRRLPAAGALRPGAPRSAGRRGARRCRGRARATRAPG